MAVAKLMSVTMDCADPETVAQFWAELLGGEIGMRNDEWIGMQIPGGLYVSAYKVDGFTPAPWPDEDGVKQFHLDVAVDDLDAGEQQVLELGATKPDFQPGADKWRVFLDPAGRPFCLMAMPSA